LLFKTIFAECQVQCRTARELTPSTSTLMETLFEEDFERGSRAGGSLLDVDTVVWSCGAYSYRPEHGMRPPSESVVVRFSRFTPGLHFPTNQYEMQNVVVELLIGAV
jgi:hypothetical protein